MAGTSKFSHHVDHDLQRLVTTWVGKILFEDVVEHYQRRDAIGATEYDQLSDLRDARVSISTAQVERLAAGILRKAKTCKLGRVAIVVSDDVSFGMSRMFSTMVAPDYTANVFRSYAEAMEWLGWTNPPAAREVTGKSRSVEPYPSA
jgi:hypothetical protein